MPVADRGTELPQALGAYFQRSTVPLTLADADRPDMPLIAANAAFFDLAGYRSDEVIGRNCRFLQGSGTTEKSRQAIHGFLDDDTREAGRFPILNYTKDGSEFHNYVFMSRLRNAQGRTRYILASQFDLTTAAERMEIGENDARLSAGLAEMQELSRGFGIAMIGSAQVLSDSIANLARTKMAER